MYDVGGISSNVKTQLNSEHEKFNANFFLEDVARCTRMLEKMGDGIQFVDIRI